MRSFQKNSSGINHHFSDVSNYFLTVTYLTQWSRPWELSGRIPSVTQPWSEDSHYHHQVAFSNSAKSAEKQLIHQQTKTLLLTLIVEVACVPIIIKVTQKSAPASIQTFSVLHSLLKAQKKASYHLHLHLWPAHTVTVFQNSKVVRWTVKSSRNFNLPTTLKHCVLVTTICTFWTI